MTYFWRALRLHCPHCGGGQLFRRWFLMRDFCYHCGFWLEREEGFYTGAIALNLVVSELLFVLALVLGIVLTWPNPPWILIQAGSIALMVLTPLIFWPFSKTLWLALDLTIRKVEPEEVVPGFDLAAAPNSGARRGHPDA